MAMAAVTFGELVIVPPTIAVAAALDAVLVCMLIRHQENNEFGVLSDTVQFKDNKNLSLRYKTIHNFANDNILHLLNHKGYFKVEALHILTKKWHRISVHKTFDEPAN